MEIGSNPLGELRISAEAYDKHGSRAADWETNGCAVNPQQRKLLYVWTGRYFHPQANNPFQGFGDFVFNDSPGELVRGHGLFAEVEATALKNTRERSCTVARCSDSEVEVMQSGDADRIRNLIQEKIAGHSTRHQFKSLPG
jgi:hypothetical protein